MSGQFAFRKRLYRSIKTDCLQIPVSALQPGILNGLSLNINISSLSSPSSQLWWLNFLITLPSSILRNDVQSYSNLTKMKFDPVHLDHSIRWKSTNLASLGSLCWKRAAHRRHNQTSNNIEDLTNIPKPHDWQSKRQRTIVKELMRSSPVQIYRNPIPF